MFIEQRHGVEKQMRLVNMQLNQNRTIT